MTFAFLPGPTGSHTIHAYVALVGASPRIGLFDANGMLLDTSLQTFVSDANSANVTCTLELVLAVTGKQLYVQPKQHSPLTSWAPNSSNSTVAQSVAIGGSSYAEGVASTYNVVVCDYWGDPAAIWVDPTWPLTRAGSGGPKANGVPADSTSYFYMTSLGSSGAPKQVTLYVNVSLSGTTPYAWLSNADGVFVGSTLALFPPVDSRPQDSAYWRLEFAAGSIPSGYTVAVGGHALPSNVNLYYGLEGGSSGTIYVTVTQGTTSWTIPVRYYGETAAPGPIWTNS